MIEEIMVANEEDVSGLIVLLSSLFEQDVEFIPNKFLQEKGLLLIIRNPQIGTIFVLKQNKIIIGMVSLQYSFSTVLGGKVATLEDMIIDKNFRKKGLGKLLLSQAIVYAKKLDCLRITLLTDGINEIAQNFYHSFGFNTSKMIPMRLVL